MIERSKEISLDQTHATDSYNEQLHLWRLDFDRTLEFASIPSDKHAANTRVARTISTGLMN
jgi:hypothetical protein